MHTAQDVAAAINSPDYQRRAYAHWSALLDRRQLHELEQLVDRFGAAATIERLAGVFTHDETVDNPESVYMFAAFLKFLERNNSAPHN